MKAISWMAAWCAILSASMPLVAHAQWIPDGQALCQASGAQNTPAVVSDGAGGAIVAWRDTRNAGTSQEDIFATRVTGAGGVGLWPSNGVALCTASGTQMGPQAAPDGAGGAVVTWRDSRQDAFGDVFATRVQADGSIYPSWPTDGVAICTAAQQQFSPVIASDNSGGAFIAWSDLRNFSDNNIFVQHLLSGGTVDPLWPANGFAVCTAADNQGNVRISPDGTGGAIVVWEDSRDFATNNKDIYIQRVTSGGAVSWTANGVPVCNVSGLQETPALVADNSGGAFVTWTDLRGISRDVFAHHITSAGMRDPSWPTQGTVLCAAVFDQLEPVIISDGAGGAIPGWRDFRNGTDYLVYAQRVSGLGVPLWAADGMPAAASAGTRQDVQVVSDAAGGAILTWRDDAASGGADIYAQRLVSNGSVASGWPTNGLIVCSATGIQSAPRTAPDAANGAIIAWGDGRLSGDDNIFSQRVTSAGVAGPTTGVLPNPGSFLLSMTVSPNPATDFVEVRLSLDKESEVRVGIQDLQGRAVETILEKSHLSSGPHTLRWSFRSSSGRRVPAGLYFAHVMVGGVAISRPIVVAR